jgi:hypothetical protein
MITPKRHNTAEEYPIATLMQHLQHALTPTQLDRLHWLLFALIALGTLAQTRVCLYLAQLTSIAPNTWRQRLKRFRQQPFPEQTLFPALLRLVVEWLRLPQVFLALDATTLGNRWTVLALGVVVHHHTIPIAWRVVRGNTKGAWLPLCEAMLALLRGALPKSMPVYVLTDRGLWSPELFGAIVRNGWHPLMRINAQGNFRPLWGRRARALASLCPARAGQQVVIAGEAFRYRLRCTLVVFWGAGAQDVWYLLTDLPARAVCGSWYGYRMWIEQGFRWLKRGCFGWHRCRVGSAVGMDWVWLVYALGCLLAAREGQLVGSEVGLWDRHRRSASVLLLGLVSLMVKCWRGVLGVDSEILSFSSGGEPK